MIWEILSLSRLQKMLKFTVRNGCYKEKTKDMAEPSANTLEVPKSQRIKSKALWRDYEYKSQILSIKSESMLET